MNNTMNILSKIAKGCLIVISLLTLIGAIIIIGICIDVSEGGGSFGDVGEIFSSVINSCSFTRAVAVIGFLVSIASLVFSFMTKCSRAVAVIDTCLGTLCFIFGLSLSPLCSLEDILGASMSNIDAEDFGTGMAVMLIFLVFFSVVRIILNIVALALRPKTAVNVPLYGYNPQMGYPQNGFQQVGYPQNGYQQGGYPQAGYPQNGFQQNTYPQNAPQQGVYPQTGYPAGFQQGNYPQQPVNTYQGVNPDVTGQNVPQSVQPNQDASSVQNAAPVQEYAAVQQSAVPTYGAPEAYVPPVVQAPEANAAGMAEDWICSNCKASNAATSRFCQNCGMQK